VGGSRALLFLALRAALVAVTIVATLLALLALGGYDAGRAVTALWNGSLGTGYAFWSGTLVRAVPLILAGVAVSLAFAGGILNIGAEGQLLAGAAAAVAVGLPLGRTASGAGGALLAVVWSLAAGAAAGAGWAGIAGLLRRRFGVLEVISTIMLNFVALYGVGYLVRGPLQEPLRIYPQSSPLPPAARLATLVPGTRLHWGFALAVVIAAGAWWTLRATAAGFRLRAVGASPRAAASAGLIDVPRAVRNVFLVSGALAGLAGAVEVTGVTYALYENLSPGYGYTAIAVALLARLNPLAVVVSALLFGALDAGAAAMQRDAGVPASVVGVVQAVVILIVLAAERWWSAAADRRSSIWGGPPEDDAASSDGGAEGREPPGRAADGGAPIDRAGPAGER
jgi:simple sugar transport system permease protein